MVISCVCSQLSVLRRQRTNFTSVDGVCLCESREFPPIIPAENKEVYIDALKAADEGEFRDLLNYLSDFVTQRSNATSVCVEGILRGRTYYRQGNRGITANGDNHPPEPTSFD